MALLEDVRLGTLNVVDSLSLAGTAVTATAAELNAVDGITSTVGELNTLDGVLGAVVFTVGTEAANIINVGMQCNNVAGTAMAVVSRFRIYLTSDADGKDFEASGPDSWAIGTDGSFLADGGDSLVSGMVISEADGDVDMNVTHSGADTFYMHAILPNGKVSTSAKIEFDSSTS